MATRKKLRPQFEASDTRKLSDLVSIGPAAIKDFRMLGISSVDKLKNQDSIVLYGRLCELTEMRHDPCVIDVFRAAIEQAENPNLTPMKRNWWYWSRVRKGTLTRGKKK